MAKLYETHGIPNGLDYFHTDYIPRHSFVLDYDHTLFERPYGLTSGDSKLWGQAEYWTALEAALLLAGVSPNDPELYAVAGMSGFGSPYEWKYCREFRQARDCLFLFERSSLAPKACPSDWVKYHDKKIRPILDRSKLCQDPSERWLKLFGAELAESSPVEELVPTVNDNPGRRERQWDVMLAVCAALKFEPLQIPDCGCAEIKSACLSRPNLFTKDGFDHAWDEGKKAHLFKMASRDKFLPKPK